jgi:1-acyl-sn-glycerol-3-phosphate acyltransferase
MIRALILGVFYLLMIPSVALIGFPWTFISGRVDVLYRMAMAVTFFGMRLIGVEVEVLGRDRFDANGTYIYMCNHISNLDPPIVVPLIPRRTSVLVKKELFRIPILSKAMLLASFVPVDRQNREAAIASIEAATQVIKEGVNITIFPEGTRSPDGKLLPFKKGPFHLAFESGAPILPMTIFGTEKLMSKGSVKIRKGKATLIFHAPISPSAYSGREELMNAVREQIASGLPAEMK